MLNDIAILKLKDEVQLSNKIQLACLPDSNKTGYPTQVGVPVWAAGWGTLTSQGNIPDVLYNVKMTYYNDSSCQNVSVGLPKDFDTQICAGIF